MGRFSADLGWLAAAFLALLMTQVLFLAAGNLLSVLFPVAMREGSGQGAHPIAGWACLALMLACGCVIALAFKVAEASRIPGLSLALLGASCVGALALWRRSLVLGERLASRHRLRLLDELCRG